MNQKSDRGDLDGRERALAALRKTQERLELALRGADLGMWDWDLRNNEVFYSDRWIKMLGYLQEEIEAHYLGWERLVHPADLPKVLEVLKAHLDGKTPFYEVEHRLRTRSGRWKWILARGQVVERDAEGRPLRCTGTHLDISERKQAEEALRYRSEFERLITSISSNFINLRFDEIDEGIEEALRRIGEFAGMDRCSVFRLADDRTRLDNTHEWCADGVEPQSGRLQGIDVGKVPWSMKRLVHFENIHVPRVAGLPPEAAAEKAMLEAQGVQSAINVPMGYGGRLTGFLGFISVREEKSWDEGIINLLQLFGEIVSNALVRKRTEEDISKFKTISDRANYGTGVVDQEGNFIYVNECFAAMHGYTPEELMGKNLSIFHTEKQMPHVDELNRQLKEFGSYESREVWHKRRDGSVFPTLMNGVQIRDEKGNPLFFAATAIDITERKEAEAILTDTLAQLRGSHADMQAILNMLSLGTVLFDEMGSITFLNRAGERLLGFEEKELLNRRWEEAFPVQAHHLDQLREMIERPAGERSRVSVTREGPAGRRIRMDVEVNDDPRNPRKKIVCLHDTSELHDLRELLNERSRWRNLIGKSKPMQLVFEQIQQLSQVDATVLIEGETGTGKELVARAIHSASHRRDLPFVAVNCSGLTDSVLHSQLFGHKRGAFTDAIKDHRGVFEVANKGTVFLDEISGVSSSVQASLLRVLEDREITPLGASKPRTIDVRILVATNRVLSDEVEEGKFRPDLLYRIRVARIQLPALRDRREDIPLLARAFLDEARAASGKPVEDIDPETMKILLEYRWPGNVRELRNAIEFSVIRCKRTRLQPEDLPPEIPERDQDRAGVPPFGRDEKERLMAALQQAQGNRSDAARLLGISRATLYRRLTKFDIDSLQQ